MENKTIHDDDYPFDKMIQDLEREDMQQRDRGTLFELLIKAYFKTEPMYSHLFDEVWMLGEVPEEYGIPKKDTGVDLVARNKRTGKLTAIQCKYYSKETTIQKSHIDSFLNEVGKNYYDQGIIITSTDKWSNNADDALLDRDKEIIRIGLSQIRESEIDWSKFSPKKPTKVKLKSIKTPRPHQKPAIDSVVDGFEHANRGKLIMAPGTGKTYISMVIAEKMAQKKKGTFKVLYFVPSIQLLSQSLKSWNADSKFRNNMETIAVCSDTKVTRKTKGENALEDITAVDIGYPATTDYHKLLKYKESIEKSNNENEMLAVFSTYQSIDVIIEAQKKGFYDFDLVICDEAHRTTGATEAGKEDSAFVKVHSDNNIKTKKRLYQTATPRVYGEDAKQKADEMSVIIADMNDEDIYGEEFYRIGFGEAIQKGILTDYKVMVLAVDEEAVARDFQTMLASEDGTKLEFNDLTKIIGCWNGLVKRNSNSNVISPNPMKRAIAFTGTIKESKMITEMFKKVVDMYLKTSENQEKTIQVEIDHADGSMNALKKNEKISWLKSHVPSKTCRILSNVRFLTEGVDVPDLDAVMFLQPRKSKIDIAQAVGRVMRKARGKDYGYVILPIRIPAGANVNTILDNDDKYRVVWDVLNGLRSLDERFDATINKLEMNKRKPDQLQVIEVGSAPGEGEGGFRESEIEVQMSLEMNEETFTEIERAIYGKIVKKVGNTRYWEDWSKDVAEIAQQHITRISIMLEDTDSNEYKAFKIFISGLRHNINGAISKKQAIEMLAQHLITKPVFEALFDSYSFVNNNPVSKAMDEITKVMDEKGLMREQKRLEGFYESVRVRADGIDNLEAKQDIIIQLYNKFFKVGFKDTTDRLGIVFTPVEVVDFIIHSVNDVLKKHFGKSINDEGVNILDPFTGTGTFIVRLLQSGLISKENLLRKYTQELHANEIVLLSYYIAAINIEETFHSLTDGDYKSFEGIVLTDTFESTEKEDSFIDQLFGENNKRLEKQQKESIFAIIGNPPYSVGARDENLSDKNIKYIKLDKSIEKTYAKHSNSKSLRSLYDTYIKAFRWASDRLEGKGVISFITNSSFIDGSSMDGLRKEWNEEFNHIYVINLRGAIRQKIGEEAKKEGGNVFDIMTGVAITVLVKDGTNNHNISYYDIGDHLTREDKLNWLKEVKSINNMEFDSIVPDENQDWINQQDMSYKQYPSMLGGTFNEKHDGIQTNRDFWVFNYSKTKALENSDRMINNYNDEIKRLSRFKPANRLKNINIDSTYISWSRALKTKAKNLKEVDSKKNDMVISSYRPFVKKHLNYNPDILELPREYKELFYGENLFISITGNSAQRDFSALMINSIPEFKLMENGKHFNIYSYANMFGDVKEHSNLNEGFLQEIKLSNMDTFMYIYAILHSKEYIKNYNNDLRKDYPRIPIVKNKNKFVEIGYKLSDLHLNYETFKSHSEVEIVLNKENPSYYINKISFNKKKDEDNRSVNDKTSIKFNKDITINNIPKEAYNYVVNGRSAIEWIINQYRVKTDKKSGIVDDPNLYSKDEKYIFNLLLSVINISVQTVDLVNSLPTLEII